MELALNALMTGTLFLPVTSIVACACAELLGSRKAEDPTVILSLLHRSASRPNSERRARTRSTQLGIAA